MITEGTIAADETVVVNCSGHTFPVESHILGDQYILNLDPKLPNRKEEGLSAALQNLDEQVTTIMVVDDNLNDRRLIRRLLQHYRSYRVYEAHNGAEALKMLEERQPDLMICDLTMPDMDGFTLLEHLKANPVTKDIPVIVVSAKTLTQQDRDLLDVRSESVWTKGGFNTRQLVDHVVRTLGHTPTEITDSPRPVTIASPIPQIEDEAAIDPDRPTIVIIEDNRQDLRLARRYLQASGNFQVIGAATGRDGLKSVYEHHPELVILDLNLPDMDGIAVLEALKSNPDLSDIPVVVMSARELDSDETENLKSKIHSILRKSSLDRADFSAIIEDVLT
jgi:CheY-like chemotaxis protein